MRAALLSSAPPKKPTKPRPPSTPPVIVDDGSGASAPPRFVLPTIDDPIVMQMRPSLPPVAQILVAKDGTGDYTTMVAAFGAVEQYRNAAKAALGLGKYEWDARVRVDIGVKPGIYDDGGLPAEMPPYVGVYALDATRGKTVFNWGLESVDGLYWEGIDVTNPLTVVTFDPKYCFHVHAGQMQIWTRCTLANVSEKAGGGHTPIGMDAIQGGTFVMHDVDLATGAYTNLHGWGLDKWSASLPGMTTIFSKVTYPTGMLLYSALNDSTADEMWVVDCDIAGIALRGARTKLHLARTTNRDTAGDSRKGHGSVDATVAFAGTDDTRSDWPIPTGGMSAAEHAKWVK